MTNNWTSEPPEVAWWYWVRSPSGIETITWVVPYEWRTFSMMKDGWLRYASPIRRAAATREAVERVVRATCKALNECPPVKGMTLIEQVQADPAIRELYEEEG